jgi:hypothetical protein
MSCAAPARLPGPRACAAPVLRCARAGLLRERETLGAESLLTPARAQGHEAKRTGVEAGMRSRLTTIFSTSRDHFASDVEATCGCVLVPPPPRPSPPDRDVTAAARDATRRRPQVSAAAPQDSDLR